MNTIIAIIVGAVALVGSIFGAVKVAQKGGKDRGVDLEARRQLEENAARRKKAEEESAKAIVIGERLAALALQYRNRRLRDLGEDPEGGGSS